MTETEYLQAQIDLGEQTMLALLALVSASSSARIGLTADTVGDAHSRTRAAIRLAWSESNGK